MRFFSIVLLLAVGIVGVQSTVPVPEPKPDDPPSPGGRRLEQL